MAGSHSSTAAAALPEASEMHQASENRSNGYHGTENCSSTPPTKAEQQTAFRKYRGKGLEKHSKEGGRQQWTLQGEHDFVKPPEHDREHLGSVMGMLQH